MSIKEKTVEFFDTILSASPEFDADYIKKKSAEECCELTTALMQNLNKRRAQNDQQIEDEIADVLMWVNKLSSFYNQDYINARIEKKKQNYFKNGKLRSDNL